MKCPKCGLEMEQGFLQWSRKDPISWVSKLLPFGMSYWKQDAEILQSTAGIGVDAAPAWVCKRCKMLVCDYSQQP